MRRIGRYIVALLALLFGRRRAGRSEEREERIVPEGTASSGAELAVIALLFLAALAAAAFVVIYAIDDIHDQTQLLGIAIGVCFALIAAALVIVSKSLIVSEELEEEYPQVGHPEESDAIDEIVRESGTPLTRKKLLAAAGASAAGTLLVAGITPALSLGPWTDTDPLFRTPWRRGRRLVDKDGRALRAEDISPETFYSAFAEGASRDDIASPLVVVRVDPSQLRLPPGRDNWAPEGIVAYSKVCTHAGCAISLYRKPTFPPTQPKPALVCPCHYSTFDPARGADVIFGPAGRPLPQLPLVIDAAGELRAGGDLSGPAGPAWPGVRTRGKS